MNIKIEKLQNQIRKVIYDFDVLSDDYINVDVDPISNLLDDDSVEISYEGQLLS